LRSQQTAEQQERGRGDCGEDGQDYHHRVPDVAREEALLRHVGLVVLDDRQRELHHQCRRDAANSLRHEEGGLDGAAQQPAAARDEGESQNDVDEGADRHQGHGHHDEALLLPGQTPRGGGEGAVLPHQGNICKQRRNSGGHHLHAACGATRG